MRRRKRENQTRFFCKNVNGITMAQDGGDLKTWAEEVELNGIDVKASPEAGLDHKNQWVKEVG